ncbi:Pentatricopeptide repeat-containing protein [Platanthera guangdongensis]|uniref:Pentatricopeptide repeat-containing protein n=1 Tax=Platanthera guangdongensis TaxID=2320717 RepID=A0ABR2MU82_9ASPA
MDTGGDFSGAAPLPAPLPAAVVDRFSKLINEHPFPAVPLRPLLLEHLLPLLLPHSPESPLLLSALFSRLFSGHSLPHKSLELFRFAVVHSPSSLSPSSIALLINSLSRSPSGLLFPSSAFLLLDLVRRAVPSLLSPAALSALLSPLARRSPDPFAATIAAFSRAETIWSAADKSPFGAAELTSLLRAFCACRRLPDARAAFRLLHSRLPPDTRAFNTLLLGFRNAGDVPSLDLFYHDLLLRGFQPDAVTYNIRIDAYCRKNRFSEALRILPEMERRRIAPTVRTITTLIHGAGIAGNPSLAREIFDRMPQTGIAPDRRSYNALMGAVVKAGDMKSGLKLLDEMNMKGIEADDVSYYTMLSGYKASSNIPGYLKIYRRMIRAGIVPRMRTVMMLMKFFHEEERWDLAMELWEYLLEKGSCPPRHALDILVEGLCFRGQVTEAYECFKQLLERGRLPSEKGVQLLEEFLLKSHDEERLNELREMISRLKNIVPSAS